MHLDPGKMIALFAVWAAYFAVHSLLAALPVKRRIAGRWPRAMAYYRLGYNALALALLAAPLGLMLAWRGPYLWRWEGPAGWIADALALAAAAGFPWTLRYYSGAEFLGLRQWREHRRTPQDQEAFRLSPLHRFVRHPWYGLGLAILWTRDMDLALLTTAVAITIYLVVGSKLEERTLVRYHGEAYRRYLEQVPGLIPRPWRHLDREGARRLARPSGTRRP
ncbi:MAG: hypothetical protein GWO16_14160 [Gammaproteobacteria bacterium]|nr:hypothetical protein [Gammaproteobacteria bacterium]NIR99073.1 hypothetical protein [Gammaproteobacteria bacterium]NIT64705.1 hypothetical protein [Gammaproteobacteria bacterium]NIV21663.1 hypothetical protein [Gammaproteobacteria bacterium]NIX10625.1 hypothetical protein [Gammaproteobacteria bacterium]